MEKVSKAIPFLKHLGFPLVNIRKALPKLTGIQQQEIAIKIGTSDKNVTAHLNDHRHNAIIQKKLAEFYGVPTEELFENE